ncbi:uncharacterized protein LOC111087751 isoform X2 [Limulus polyphemus]|uniref:Uncharacterized protein LOC111087751 isoform X2 n=1 Tax=Limulus polyphemus TaxID=6850 RepID=A0ABM1T5S9_LIMPO|nr:uncharacterized protein LOC111087751 isoform X2 [Limulus polyphemus]
MKSKDLLLFLSLLVLCMPRDGAVFQQCVCSVYASNKGGLVSTNFIRDKKHVIPRLGCDNQARDMCAGLCRYRVYAVSNNMAKKVQVFYHSLEKTPVLTIEILAVVLHILQECK